MKTLGKTVWKRRTTHKYTTVLLTTLLLAIVQWVDVAQAESPDDVIIIANASLRVSSVTVGDLREIFLKKRTSFSSGEKAIPIHSSSAELRKDFRERVLYMSDAEEQIYWHKRKIKDGESEPAMFRNVLKAVYKLRGAISYVYRKHYNAKAAKVVLVLPAR